MLTCPAILKVKPNNISYYGLLEGRGTAYFQNAVSLYTGQESQTDHNLYTFLQ